MFNAVPHPAEPGVLAVHETYSRTTIYTGAYPPSTKRRPSEKNVTAVLLNDRHALPSRGFVRLGSSPRSQPLSHVPHAPIVVVVGANGTSREHLLSTRIADCLAVTNLRVAVARLTGGRRTVFRESCHWISTSDLSEYGYQSTQSCDPRELAKLFEVQMQDLSCYSPDVVVVELCGTLWRHDVRNMLSVIGRSPGATTAVLSASDPGAAALALDLIGQAGVGVSAIWSPLAEPGRLSRDARIRETRLPVCGRGESPMVARAILGSLQRRWLPLSNGMFSSSCQEYETAA